MVSGHSRTSYRLSLLLMAALSLAVYMTVSIGWAEPRVLVLSWAVDACGLGVAWWLSELLAKLRLRFAGVAALLVFFPLFYFCLVSSFAHTYFFEGAGPRRISLLDIDLGGIYFFFTRVLPARGWVILVTLLTAVHVGAWLMQRRLRAVSGGRALLVLLIFSLTTGAALARSPRVPSPMVDIAYDFWELGTMHRVELDPNAHSVYPLTTLDKRAHGRAHLSTPFKKVLVFVMETMIERELAEESAALPADTLVKSWLAHAHRYTHYFPNNQDSRTGMLDMLTSRVIPYEAYSEADRDHYMFLSKQPSLVDRFRALGYETAYALSQTELELVVSDLKWDATIRLNDTQIRAAKQHHLCFAPYEFEDGCEDRALLPQVFDFIDRHERVFLYQEFIWGHDIEYNRASGKTNTQYYSAYLDEVVAHLQQQGTLDETLIVLTSDHGFRDKSLQDKLFAYQIPLFFFAKRFSHSDDSRLVSHIDFKDLLFSELGAEDSRVDHNPFVMIVGPTGTSMLAVLTDAEEFLLWKHRGDTQYLLQDAWLGGSGAQRTTPSSATFLNLFTDYRRDFDASALNGH